MKENTSLYTGLLTLGSTEYTRDQRTVWLVRETPPPPSFSCAIDSLGRGYASRPLPQADQKERSKNLKRQSTEKAEALNKSKG